jgi:hypothetical protein
MRGTQANADDSFPGLSSHPGGCSFSRFHPQRSITHYHEN